MSEQDKNLLCDFLIDHRVFALKDADRKETDLIHLEIDMSNASPIMQLIRRMPFAAQFPKLFLVVMFLGC